MNTERIEKVKEILNDLNLTPLLIKDNIDSQDVEGFGIYKDNKPEIRGHRYYLYIDLEKNGIEKGSQKILTAIMLNPSKSLPQDGFDDTVSNVIRIAQKTGFSAVEVLNLFSYIEPEIKDAKKYFRQEPAFYKINELNTTFIKKFLLVFNNPVLVAWGENFINSTRHEQVKGIIKLLTGKDVYTFCNKDKNMCKGLKNDYPKHPGRLNNFEEKCIKNCHNGDIKLQKYNFMNGVK